MVGLTENIQACLRDFLSGAASMARKRHLASTARGFLMFLSYGLIGQLLHMALCCLEGSTMSNLVHRRRRCARIVHYMILLPGRQYARGWGRSLHQAKDIVVAPGEPIFYCHRQLFCFLGA